MNNTINQPNSSAELKFCEQTFNSIEDLSEYALKKLQKELNKAKFIKCQIRTKSSVINNMGYIKDHD